MTQSPNDKDSDVHSIALTAIKKFIDALPNPRFQAKLDAPQANDPDSPILRDDNLRLALEVERARARIDEMRQTQKLRDKYAKRVYWIVVLWIVFAMTMLLLDALDPPSILTGNPCIARLLPAFDIETKVMMTFLGGTTIAIVGLVLAVVKGLFSSRPND